MTSPQHSDDSAIIDASAGQPESGPAKQSPTLESRAWSPSSRPGASQGVAPAPAASSYESEPPDDGGGTAVITSRKVDSSVASGAAARDGRASWLTIGLVGLLAALLALGTMLLALRYEAARATDAARAQGGQASRDAARILSSYDYKTLAKDRASALEVTTGDLRKKYETSFDKLAAPLAKQANAVVRGDVTGSSVTEASSSELTALLFLNQTVISNLRGTSGPGLIKHSMQLHMAKVDGKWLVDQLTLD